MLAELFKGKGDLTECSSSRGILISDAGGKQWHSWVREGLANHQRKSHSRDTQFSDTVHAGTDLCSLLARTYWAWIEALQLSGYSLFVDIVGAFDAVVRRFVSDNGVDDEKVARALAAMGMPPEMMHKLAGKIASGDANLMRKTAISEHLAAVISDAHASSWHTVQGISDVTVDVMGGQNQDTRLERQC